MKWPGAIHVLNTDNLTLIGNTVAGSEKVGLKWTGQKCSDEGTASDRVRDNEIHATLFGIHVPREGKYKECVFISGFKVSM